MSNPTYEVQEDGRVKETKIIPAKTMVRFLTAAQYDIVLAKEKVRQTEQDEKVTNLEAVKPQVDAKRVEVAPEEIKV